MVAETGEPFALGDWLVEPALNRMSAGPRSLHLRPQVMEVLVYLAGRDGKVATLESIHDELWAGRVVSSGTIYNCIAELRQAFARSGSGLDHIETLPKKGYRIAPQILTPPPAPAADSALLSIVILPLANRNAEGMDYLCDGIADEILHGLSNVAGLRVYSARALKNELLDTRVIGLRYAAQLVLSGSLQSRGRRLRALFRLENVADGRLVWSGRFEQDEANLFDLQDEAARQVIAAIAPLLSHREEVAPEGSGTRNVEALKAFLLGRQALSGMTFRGQEEAIRCFERAVALDPAFARAHYRLYLAHYMRCRIFGADEDDIGKARTAAFNARTLGYRPAVPWVHVHRRLHPEARLGSRALALEAIDRIRDGDAEWGSFAFEQLSWVLADSGLFEASLAFARKVLASPDHNYEDSDVDEEVPGYTAASGYLDEAIGLWSALVQKDPARPLFRGERSILYARTAQYAYARMDLAALGHRAYRALGEAFLAYYEGRADDVGSQHKALLALRNLHPSLALCTAFLVGDVDGGFDYYEKTVSELERSFVDFGVARAMTRARMPESLVTAIERHPRFADLLASQGIDDDWQRELAERVNAVANLTGVSVARPAARRVLTAAIPF